MLHVFYCSLLIFGSFIETETSKCEKLSSLATLEDHNTVVETSLRLLAGFWISEGCETRPGPEYILRSYSFDSDGRYHLIQHHYWDDSCSSAKLSIISHGRLQLRKSLVQIGAADAALKVSNISVIPQDDNAAEELDRIVTRECPGQYWKSWRRYEEYTVYKSRHEDKNKRIYNLWSQYDQDSQQSVNSRGNLQPSDIACLASLKSAFNELKLLKIQLRPLMETIQKRPKVMRMELLLGDIHSNHRQREFYSPTSFQVPLIKQTKNEVVSINRHSYVIKTVNTIPTTVFTARYSPPHLIEKPHLPPYIWGEWTSTRCEVRPMGLYLTRRFSFYPDDSTWIGEHKFYSDPFCKIPKFIVTAAGHFTLNGPNQHLKGTTNIDFEIERASLTVLDQKMIYDMRLPGLCGQDEWEVNVPKELSSTNGCMQLGITLPSKQFDIVKMEMDYKGSCLLFMGQIETDSLHVSSNERPTAFQLPLVKCGEVATYSQALRDILHDNMYINRSNYLGVCNNSVIRSGFIFILFLLFR